MKTSHKLLILLTTGFILTGCINQPKPGSPESAALIQQKKEEKVQEANQAQIDALPEWAKIPPESDLAIYGVGSSTHSDMSTARRAAIVKAQAQVAENLDSRLSQSTKVWFDESTFDATGNSDKVEQAIKTVVAETTLRGLKIKEIKFAATGSKVTAYTLIEYPIGDANRALVEQIRKDAALAQEARKNDAFKELEAEVERLKNS
ncbi:MAG: hypothetical protein CMD99_02235 [Gammaproteobacteria bacterium]|nr:hypothetical protein [Gammaproteobacteria bacterium]